MKKLSPIGLVISDAELSAVLLGQNKRSGDTSLEGWSREPLSAGTIQSGRIVKPALLTASLEQLFSNPNSGYLDGRGVVLSLPESVCQHHIASIGNHQECHQMEKLARRVMESKTASEPDDLAWTWDTSLDDLHTHHLSMSATSKSLLERYEFALKTLGMNLISAEGQSHSRNRYYFDSRYAPEPLLHIHLGRHQTTIALLDALGTYQTSLLDGGYQDYLLRIARSMRLSEEQAERVLKAIGLRSVRHEKAFLIQDAIYSELTDLEKEARQFIAYYKYHQNNHPLAQRLKVTGEGAMVPGIPEWLSQRLELPLRIYSSPISFSPSLSHDQVAFLSDAIGAALIERGENYHFLMR